jgi:hypothetical protein
MALAIQISNSQAPRRSLVADNSFAGALHLLALGYRFHHTIGSCGPVFLTDIEP